MAAISLLHRVNREKADRVNRQLIQLRRIESCHDCHAHCLFLLPKCGKTCKCAGQKPPAIQAVVRTVLSDEPPSSPVRSIWQAPPPGTAPPFTIKPSMNREMSKRRQNAILMCQGVPSHLSDSPFFDGVLTFIAINFQHGGCAHSCHGTDVIQDA